MKTFKLNNIEVKKENKGIVSIQLYNVAGFEKAIKVVAGYDLDNHMDDDSWIYYAFENDKLVTLNNKEKYEDYFDVKEWHDERGNYVKLDYPHLFDYVVAAVKEYYEIGNKFITAIINHRIYSQLV